MVIKISITYVQAGRLWLRRIKVQFNSQAMKLERVRKSIKILHANILLR